ncbi:MAG TPA: NUDIX hydrolase [Longimicrobiaceae bacterium]|nr:NUDIX hydrolase [Longimicrobiaceae bacterium]
MEDQEQAKPQAAEWETLSRTDLAEYEMFSVRRERVRVAPGETKDFEIVDAPDGVVVVALTAAGEMVLVEQYRVPLGRVTLELPAGIVEHGEDPVEGGRRELREETGYEGGDAEHLGTMALNPSWQTTRVHVVAVRGARRTASKELDEAEDTRVRLLTREQVDAHVADGRVDAAVTLAALAILDRAKRS